MVRYMGALSHRYDAIRSQMWRFGDNCPKASMLIATPGLERKWLTHALAKDQVFGGP
jgi:hypothetical protein